jgi:organic radical activating enzyme
MPDINSLLSSKSFCILPWLSVTVNTKGEITPCCISDTVLMDANAVNEHGHGVLNSQPFKTMRKMMMLGVLPESCKQCSVSGKKTLREVKNESLINKISKIDIDRIENTSKNGSISDPKIRYVDVRASNICNLKCRTCSPVFSSRIQQEEKSVIKFSKPLNLTKRPEILSELKEIYFAGGEPLITEDHYKILESLPNDVSVIYNTNFTVTSFKNFSVFDFWEKKDKLFVSVSLDEIGNRLSYLRHGSDYDKIIENFKTFHKRIPNSFEKIKISITLSIFNIFYLHEILEDFEKHNLVKPENISINFLYYPSYFRCNNFEKELGQFRNEAVDKIKNEVIKNLVKTFLYENLDAENDFSKFLTTVEEKDKLRNERFKDIYPEIANLLMK